MLEFTYEPEIQGADEGPFVQQITLRDGEQVIGRACWAAEGEDGVVQILTLSVEPALRRRGHGRRLLAAVIEQLSAYHRQRRLRPRRLWMVVRQKTQVIGRSFLTGGGFHHIATIPDLYRDEDALIYQRAFD